MLIRMVDPELSSVENFSLTYLTSLSSSLCSHSMMMNLCMEGVSCSSVVRAAPLNMSPALSMCFVMWYLSLM